ncbi:MAG: methylated-DNA--[protein]-cysteine S-methyltransferase [Nitrospirae bacterium]|nr:methylated-DNA--[protein]-cysteine S-methyltransferase [Nitrospirota bacterium]
MKEENRDKSLLFYDTFESPIGTLYLIFNGKFLNELSFTKPSELLKKDNPSSLIKKELKEYFENGREEFTQKTAFNRGSEFDKKVWLTLREIPYGETRTYRWLAEKLGKPSAYRAVGRALSRNPLPIIFPCHRIIESDGSIGGYSSGIDIKRRLLDFEYYFNLSKKT